MADRDGNPKGLPIPFRNNSGKQVDPFSDQEHRCYRLIPEPDSPFSLVEERLKAKTTLLHMISRLHNIAIRCMDSNLHVPASSDCTIQSSWLAKENLILHRLSRIQRPFYPAGNHIEGADFVKGFIPGICFWEDLHQCEKPADSLLQIFLLVLKGFETASWRRC
jgi:hypothetical protein